MANVHLSYADYLAANPDKPGLTNWVKYNWIGAGEEHGWVIMCKKDCSKIGVRGYIQKVLGFATEESGPFVDKWYTIPLPEDTRMFTYANHLDFDDVELGVYATEEEAQTQVDKILSSQQSYYYIKEI